MKLAISHQFQLVSIFTYLLKKYQVTARGSVSWSYLFIYKFISKLKTEIFVLGLLLQSNGSGTSY